MRVLFTGFVLLALLCACGGDGGAPRAGAAGRSAEQPAPFSEFTEGVSYKRLQVHPANDLPAGQLQVVEFFSYTCPYCRDVNPYLDTWVRRDKPDYVKFFRVPVIWDGITRLQARMYYTAEVLGKNQDLHVLAFHEPLNTEESIADFFAAHGVDRQTFTTTFQSAEVQSRVQEAIRLRDLYDMKSVPTIIIDGRYLTDTEMAGSRRKLITVINELIVREAARAGLTSGLQHANQ